MYRFAWNLAWLITSATPPHMPTLVVVARRGWSRHMREISHLCFFSFFFCFLRHDHRSHFLTDLYDPYVKRRLSGQVCAYWASKRCYARHIRPHSHSPFRHCHRVGDPPHLSLDCPSVHCLGVAAGWFAPAWARWLWREVYAARLNWPIEFIHLLDASGVTSIDSSLKYGWRT